MSKKRLFTLALALAALLLLSTQVAYAQEPPDFQIIELTADNSAVVDHSVTTGDDRGGIATSNSQLFYSGDGATGRFSLNDLSGGTNIGTRYDMMISDLATGQVYLLGNGGVEVPEYSGNQTVSQLLEVDDTGAIVGTITLDTPFVINTDPDAGAMFAGYGRVVVHNRTNGEVWAVATPSGVVTSLPAVTLSSPALCENWALWGIAEHFGGEDYLVYVQAISFPWNDIVRTRLSDGTTTVLADFTDLNDMCSISANLERGRWYFHHEWDSQFGGSGTGETAGYADASGYYSFTTPIGVYTATASHPMYTTAYTPVTIITDTVITQDWYLSARGRLHGYVTDDDTGEPIAATLIISGWGSVDTDPASGYYEVYLDEGSYDLEATADNYASEYASVSITSGADTQQDFSLTYSVAFEPSPLHVTLDWQTTASFPVTITNRLPVTYPFEFGEGKASFMPMLLAQPNVLIARADSTAEPIRGLLQAYGDLGAVDDMDARSYTPSLAELLAYDVVVTWGNEHYQDPTAWGDVMADYVDAGGRVVHMVFGMDNSSANLLGRFWNQEYDAMRGNAIYGDTVCLGTCDAGHPIMQGVTAACSSARVGPSPWLLADSYAVAEFTDGWIYVAAKNDASVVNISTWQVSGYWSGQFPDMVHNAILWQTANVPWFGQEPVTGTVPASGTLTAPGTFAATMLFTATSAVGINQPGHYNTSLFLGGDPGLETPVVMTVLPTASMGKVEGYVLDRCSGDGVEAHVAISGGLPITETMAYPDGYYNAWLDVGTYELIFSAAGYLSDTYTVDVTAGVTTTLDVDLFPDQACVSVEPGMFEVWLVTGTLVYTHPTGLDLTNLGGQALDFEMVEHEGAQDVPWMWEDPVTGTVPSDYVLGTSNVEVAFTAVVTDPLPLGTYTATLEVASNAPGDAPMLPVVMHVVQEFITPTAGFESNAPVCLGDMAVFTNTTVVGVPPDTTYLWDLGDGATSTDFEPTHVYTAAGTYTVTLQACNTAPSPQCDTYAEAHQVLPLPLADFGYLVNEYEVTFTNLSQNTDTYVWHFGDGVTSTLESPVHTYPMAGVYTVTLWATGDCGADMAQDTVSVGGAPQALWDSNSPVCLGQVMDFGNNSTGTLPIDYLWGFGDGVTSTLEAPSHLYAADGVYTVSLEASNAFGSDVETGQVEVLPLPVAGFDYLVDFYTAQFTNTSMYADAYLWDLGDGATSTETHPVHTYATSGTYQVMLQASGDCGSDTFSDTVTIEHCEPVAGLDLILITSGPINPGALAEFEVNIMPDDFTPPYNYVIDYGDGTVVTDTDSLDPLSLSHTYLATGTYDVTVYVWNCDMVDPEMDTVQVTVEGEPVCYDLTGITIAGETSGYPGTYLFTTSYAPPEATPPIAYLWDDGGTDDTSSRYLDVGVHTLVVTATNCPAGILAGGTDALVTDTHQIEIMAALACTRVTDIDLTLVTTGTLYPNDPVDFSANIMPDDAGKPYSYTINYGDGTVINGDSSDDPLLLQHTYNAVDVYDVTVTVWNCPGSAPVPVFDTIQIEVYEPGTCLNLTGVALTLETAGDVYAGAQVDFGADLMPDDATVPYSYTIDYGDSSAQVDGSSSDDPFSFNYTYAATGTYTVTFWAWNCGMIQAISDTVEVMVQEPVFMIYLPLVLKN